MKTTLHFITLGLLFCSVISFAQPINDSCQNARILFALDSACITMSFQDATFDRRDGTCAPDTTPNVWFRFTAQGPDLDVNVASPGDAYISVFEVNQSNYCADSLWSIVSCKVNDMSFTNRLSIGRTYMMSVAFADSTTNQYQLCINNPFPEDPPSNGSPCGAESIVPDGSCYGGYNVDAPGQWLNPDCPTSSESSVWYRFFMSPGHSRLRFTMSSNFTDDYSVFLARFNNNSCTSYPIIVGDTLYCDDLPDPDTVIFENLSAGQVYYLQVASEAEGAGIFQFCVEELPDPEGCGVNNTCIEASPIAIDASETDTICFTGCNQSASPGPTDLPGGCFYMQYATVWHEITPDVSAAAMRIIVNGITISNPHIALYVGDSCSNMTPVVCDFSTTGTVDIALFDLIPSKKYFLAVTDLFGEEGEYNVCIDQFELEGFDCNLISTLRAVETSYGSPLAGPYQSGEQVEFCYSIIAWQKGLCNWLQGIAPRFGPAWDETSFRINGEPSNITTELEAHVPGNWRWYSEGVVTYNTENAVKGYTTGSPLPGGWYFTNNDYSQTNPNQSRGDSDNCDLESGVTWEVCFTLNVKNYDECITLPPDAASIRMESFADGEIGIYPAVSCLDDQPDLLAANVSCCEGPSIADANFNSCNGDLFSYDLNPMNESGINYSWDVIVPDGVFGPEAGTGDMIEDVITNFTTSQQTVFYVVSISDSAGCFGPLATISVNVQPALLADAGGDQTVCDGTSLRLGGTPTAMGGSGNYNYFWSNSAGNSANPLISAESSQYYYVIVTDSRGCRATDSMFLSVVPTAVENINGNLCKGDTLAFFDQEITAEGEYQHTIIAGSQNGCDSIVNIQVTELSGMFLESGSTTPDEGSENGTISIDIGGGMPPYNIAWSNGSVGPNISGLRFGSYTATVTDANDCVFTIEIIVELMNATTNTNSEAQIVVFPSIIHGPQTISISNPGQREIQFVEVFNGSGQLVDKQNIVSTATEVPYSFKGGTAGIYLVRVHSEGIVSYHRVMVVK